MIFFIFLKNKILKKIEKKIKKKYPIMDFDLQSILLDQFLDVSVPLGLKKGQELESSPASFTADSLDLSSLNFDMSSSNTTTSNTTVATPNENLSAAGGHFDLDFDLGSIDDALNNNNNNNSNGVSLPDEITSPLALRRADYSARTDDVDLNNLLSLNLDMFLTASSPVSSTTTTTNAPKAGRPLSSVSKKRSKSLTTTHPNRASNISKPKIRGRKPSLHYDDSEVFKCELCERRFKRQEHLKRHVSSLHMGERPYQCDICLKSFSRSDNLSQHKRIHNNTNGGTNVQKRSSSASTNSRRVSARI